MRENYWEKDMIIAFLALFVSFNYGRLALVYAVKITG